jgi:hypothetical protein
MVVGDPAGLVSSFVDHTESMVAGLDFGMEVIGKSAALLPRAIP